MNNNRVEEIKQEDKKASETMKQLEEIKKRALQSSSALSIELLNIKENF